jgi:heme O synthase-like polyprenyltransferase
MVLFFVCVFAPMFVGFMVGLILGMLFGSWLCALLALVMSSYAFRLMIVANESPNATRLFMWSLFIFCASLSTLLFGVVFR